MYTKQWGCVNTPKTYTRTYTSKHPNKHNATHLMRDPLALGVARGIQPSNWSSFRSPWLKDLCAFCSVLAEDQRCYYYERNATLFPKSLVRFTVSQLSV